MEAVTSDAELRGREDLAPAADYRSKVASGAPHPVVLDPEWLPAANPWEELDELREVHVRLCRRRRELHDASRQITARHEAEDQAVLAARKLAATRGSEPELPQVTPPEQRKAELAEVGPQSAAVLEALLDHVDALVETIYERSGQWLGELDEIEGEIAERYNAKLRELDAIKAEKGKTYRLRHWVERTAQGNPNFHLQFNAIPVPPPLDGPARDAWIEAQTNKSFGNGMRQLPDNVVAVRNPDPDAETDWIYVRQEDLPS